MSTKMLAIVVDVLRVLERFLWSSSSSSSSFSSLSHYEDDSHCLNVDAVCLSPRIVICPMFFYSNPLVRDRITKNRCFSSDSAEEQWRLERTSFLRGNCITEFSIVSVASLNAHSWLKGSFWTFSVRYYVIFFLMIFGRSTFSSINNAKSYLFIPFL